MTKYSIIHPCVLAFYSRDLYCDVARSWGSKTFGYLLLLLLVCWTLFFVCLQLRAKTFISDKLSPLTEQIPEVNISAGIASSPIPQPYQISDPITKKPLVTIDTTGQYLASGPDPQIVITRDTLIVYRHDYERSIKLTLFPDVNVTKHNFISFVEGIYTWTLWLALPVCVAISFVYRLLQVLAYGLIGMLFMQIQRVRLEYEALVRLSIISITPVIIVQTAISSFGLSVPFLWPLSFVAALAYLWVGVRSATCMP